MKVLHIGFYYEKASQFKISPYRTFVEQKIKSSIFLSHSVYYALTVVVGQHFNPRYCLGKSR